ncbi:hypothetical protein, partial [Amycolatopsis sacchari]|uniref:hypothetical protein n=1 Tax=Amycolatopsis sacchari TaxID=115433 RepID=UPI003EB97161
MISRPGAAKTLVPVWPATARVSAPGAIAAVAMTLHGFVAGTSQRAAEIYFPADAELFNVVGAAKGIQGVT